MEIHIKYFKLSDIIIQIISDLPIAEDTFHPKFKLFETSGPGKDTIRIYHHFSIPGKILKLLNQDNTKKIFSNSFLSVFKSEDSWIYEHKYSAEFNIRYNAVVLFNNEHTVGNVYTNDLDAFSYSKAKLSSVVLFGGDHYLISNIFSSRKGLLLHANGLIYNGKGIVLLGKSGAGKSTLSGMLKANGFKMVADDRIILQRKAKGLFLIGSWCHGSVIEVTNMEVMVDKIFLLEKALENRITTLSSNREIVKHFAGSIVRPFGDQKKWADILNQIDEIIKEKLFCSLLFDLSGEICRELKETL